VSHHSVTSSIHALVLVAKSRCKKQSLCKDTKTSGVAVCGSWTHRHVKTLGMTQEQIADCLGISRRTVIRHQAGERVIKLNFAQIRRLKELLEQAGMSLDLLQKSNFDTQNQYFQPLFWHLCKRSNRRLTCRHWLRRYQFIPVSRGGCNSYEMRLREGVRSLFISNRKPFRRSRLLMWGMRSLTTLFYFINILYFST